MRKHPLLAFAASTIALSAGATSLGATNAFASIVHLQRRSTALKLIATSKHRHMRHRLGHPRRHRGISVVATTGPTGFLLPKTASTSSPAAAASVAPNVWAMLRNCESGGNYREDTGNGYYGAYQFALSSWQRVGGTGLPNLAPPSVQDLAAQRLMAIQGWQAWPVCSEILGIA